MLANGTVLIVEDDNDLRESLTQFLKQSGYAVASAMHGQEALSRLRSGVKPCVILLDLMMPVMDGWEFCEEQQQDPALAEIPVVVLSARVSAAQDAALLHVADYVRKPIALDRLLQAIGRCCGGSP